MRGEESWEGGCTEAGRAAPKWGVHRAWCSAKEFLGNVQVRMCVRETVLSTGDTNSNANL